MQDVVVRQLEERDLPEADRIVRLAFGTFLGMPDPMRMFGDSDIARTRFRTDPRGALAAELDGRLAGSNFVANWGSVGYFGPLSVDPPLWERKIAQRLLDSTVELFRKWEMRHTGLFTFPHSPKHIALYQKYDFWPRYLTEVMALRVESAGSVDGARRFSALNQGEKQSALNDARAMLSAIYDGLDVTVEIEAVDRQKLGDTIFLYSGSRLDALAVCHIGAGSEGGSGNCYIKFGAVRPGNGASAMFEKMLDAAQHLALDRGAARLEAGVNTERHAAYRAMLARGFRTFISGVMMQQANDRGYNAPDIFVLDDWR